MRLLEIIRKKHAIPDLKAKDKWETIEEMISYLVEKGEIPAERQSEVVDAVVAREKSKSTGMADHVAIPHAATDAVEKTTGLIGISRQGIPFESLDDKEAKIICMLIYPQNTFQRHVRTLAGIARLMSDARFREDIIDAETKDDIVQIIENREEKESELP